MKLFYRHFVFVFLQPEAAKYKIADKLKWLNLYFVLVKFQDRRVHPVLGG